MPTQVVEGCDHLRGDLSDLHNIYRILREREIDTIVHCGAVSSPMLACDNPFFICETNVIGTIQLMEAARQNGIRRFVYLSSAAVYGATPPAPVPRRATLDAARDIGFTPKVTIFEGVKGYVEWMRANGIEESARR